METGRYQGAAPHLCIPGLHNFSNSKLPYEVFIANLDAGSVDERKQTPLAQIK
jgi:hypothetical protein